MIIYSLIRRQVEYPFKEVENGVKTIGLTLGQGKVCSGSDFGVVTWNCYGHSKAVADAMKSAGGLHVAMENGYMQRKKGYFTMGLGGFNGTELLRKKGASPDRFEKLGVAIKPWRAAGDHILVCGQRGYGYNAQAMQNDWPEKALWELRKHTDRKILYRPHPARVRLPKTLPSNTEVVSNEGPLAAQMLGAHAVVVWTSNAATEALLKGFPVVYDGNAIACAELAVKGLENIEQVRTPDREQRFWDLAWQQWRKDEIEFGIPWGVFRTQYAEYKSKELL